MQTLEESLLNSTEHADALQLIEHVRQECSFIGFQSGGGSYLEGLEMYLDYMVKTWMPIELWRGWSRAGRNRAATRLGIALEGVIPTTNHLESLNGALKRKYIPQWQHSGHRLRFDILIYHLVSGILPQIYAQQRMITDYSAWKARRFELSSDGPQSAAGSDAANSAATKTHRRPRICYAFYTPDRRRDADAQGILASGKLRPISSARPHEQWPYCVSMSDSSTRYWLTAHPSGAATCTCPDWLQRGGACKHMRAFRLLIESWMAQGHLLPNSFFFPMAISEAEAVDARNRAWYGEWFERSVTTPAQSEPIESRTRPLLEDNLNTTEVRPSALASKLPPTGFPNTSPHADGECSAMQLPQHLESARSALRHFDEVPQLLPPTHPLLGNLLEAEASRASDVMELTGDSVVVDLDKAECTLEGGAESGPSENERALAHQLNQRFRYDVSRVTPILHGMTTYLDDPHFMVPQDEVASEFRGLILAVNAKMSNAPERASGGGEQVCAAESPRRGSEKPEGDRLKDAAPGHQTDVPTTKPKGMVYRSILPPSPEKRQKRHDSRGIH